MQKGDLFRKGFCNIVMGAVVLVVLLITITPKAITTDVKPSAIYSGRSDTNVSLMVNVYSGGEYIVPMLDIFEKKGVKTTFFIAGNWILGNEELLKLIKSSGHQIGNHGFNRIGYKGLSEQRIKEEILYTHDIVKDKTGYDMALFAPPLGSFDKTTLKTASALGYKTIMWTKDTEDILNNNKTTIFKRATEGIKSGSLILIHPTAATLEVLDQILGTLITSGLNITTVSETL